MTGKGKRKHGRLVAPIPPIRVFLSACFLNHSPPVQSFWPMPCSHDGVETRSSASFPGCWTCHYRTVDACLRGSGARRVGAERSAAWGHQAPALCAGTRATCHARSPSTAIFESIAGGERVVGGK